MATSNAKRSSADDDIRPEYDFSSMKLVGRGRYAKRMRQGHSVHIHNDDGSVEVHHYVEIAADVHEYFPDSESVNKALRALIALIPQKPRRSKLKGQRRA
jgi:hypothetical protein